MLSEASAARAALPLTASESHHESHDQLIQPTSKNGEHVGHLTPSESGEGDYTHQTIYGAVKARVGWLALFLIGLWSAAFVIDRFEHMLQRNVELAHFVPLIIGHGGNAGSQSVGSVIRAIAANEIDPSLRATVARVISRETLIGALCGLVLGCMVLTVGLLTHIVSLHVGTVVAISLPLVSLWANFIGALLPLLASRLGLNPALTSAPLMTTIIDSSGLLIYFLVAWAYFDFGEAHHLVDYHHSLGHHMHAEHVQRTASKLAGKGHDMTRAASSIARRQIRNATG
jgi:cation transporter-like permease